MSDPFTSFAARLVREIRADSSFVSFPDLALELFRLQWAGNEAYRRYLIASDVLPDAIRTWQDIPAVPTAAFKELELTSLPASLRTRVFHSSGTTARKPSRHYHGPASLALYEASMLAGFQRGFLRPVMDSGAEVEGVEGWIPVSLTPPPGAVPHSSLVHMIDGVGRRFGAGETVFIGHLGTEGTWELDTARALSVLRASEEAGRRVVVFGTAFSFVHLVEGLEQKSTTCRLVAGSRVMETGGYKGRSREWTKAELRGAMSRSLGVPPLAIVGEYGMSELSTQAYEAVGANGNADADAEPDAAFGGGFEFPPWARPMVISPETGKEASEGEPGLLRVIDLANVWSVMAVQTEDRVVARRGRIELLGRAPMAEPRGCSLMAA